MNKKIGLFLCIIVTTNHIYSQQSLNETEHEDAPSLHELEMSPEADDDQHLQETDHEQEPTEHTSEDLHHIATREANKDLVGLLDTLESGTKKVDVDFNERHEDESQSDASDEKNHDAEDFEEPTIEGIDTVDLEQPQGNWLFKRIWWERSEARYEKIKQKIEEIFENRMIFFEKRSALVREILDPFYLKIGMGQGEFQAILSDLVQSLEKERDKKGSLTPQERDLLTMLDSQRETLEQLSIDVQAIGEVENRVEESLAILLDQMKALRSYDIQAWQAFKEIARVLDDEKAFELYHAIDTSWHNIKDIGDYLDYKFAAHFDKLLTEAKEQTERVTETVAALKEKGIDFKKQAEQLMAPKPVQKVAKEEQEEEEPEEEQGFFTSYILNPLSAAWNGIVSVVTWPYYAIFGSSHDEESEEAE